MKIFGFEFGTTSDKKDDNLSKTFTQPLNDEAAVDISRENGIVGSAFGTYIDLGGNIKTEADAISQYREMALDSDVETAIDDIINEAIVMDREDSSPVFLNVDNIDYSDSIKDKITNEFETIKELLDFNNQAYEIFKRFYVDGRLNYQIIINEDNPREGIKNLIYLDPRKIKKIRELDRNVYDGSETVSVSNEYYIFSEIGFGAKTVEDTKNTLNHNT